MEKLSLYNIIWENWVKYGFERDFTIEVCKKKKGLIKSMEKCPSITSFEKIGWKMDLSVISQLKFVKKTNNKWKNYPSLTACKEIGQNMNA